MSARGADALIEALVADLAPVTPLPGPFARALRFVALLPVAAGGLLLASRYSLSDTPPAVQPYLVGATFAALATATLAAWAAFAASLPDRSPRWALLPLPALAVWLVLTGAGCVVGADGAWGLDPQEAGRCLLFILIAAVPLATVMGLMLRRVPPLRPRLAMLLGGLAAAAGAAGLLGVVHPHGSAVLDVAAHVVAVAAVTATAGALGGRIAAARPLGS